MRLPNVIADLSHLNTSLKLPIETESGGIGLKNREKEGGGAVIAYRKRTADEGFPVIFVIFVIIDY